MINDRIGIYCYDLDCSNDLDCDRNNDYFIGFIVGVVVSIGL